MAALPFVVPHVEEVEVPALVDRVGAIWRQHAAPPRRDPADGRARRATAGQDEVPRPFTGATEAYALYSRQDYGQRLLKWMADLAEERHTPNAQQWTVLERVRSRLLQEVELYSLGAEARPPLGACSAGTIG